jgi:hypothetical protein
VAAEAAFQDFFLAVAGASATLIGLLFVAVSVAPEQVVGPKAQVLHQIRATMALAAFASALVLALIAILPDAHVGWPATVIGAGGVSYSIQAVREQRHVTHDPTRRRATLLIVIYLLIMALLCWSGVRSIVDPGDRGPISDIGIAVIALIALGIDRSWELVGGRTTGVTGFLSRRLPGNDASRSRAELGG